MSRLHEKLTVVIPTKNRTEELKRTLQTLANQTVLPDRLIMIDQSSDRMEIGDLPFDVTHIYDTNITGAAQARNRALDLISHGLVLFLDDDVELEPSFIEELLATYSDYPEADGVSGVITNYSPSPLWKRVHDKLFRLGPFFDERHRIYWNADKLIHSGPIRVRKFTGCLMSFRQTSIGKLRFDEKLTKDSLAEDSDFCYALGPKAVLLICPRARLRHLKTSTAREKFHWLEREARSASYFFGRHHAYGFPRNRLVYGWFKVGLWILAVGSCARRCSLQPFREFRSGTKIGKDLASKR